MTAPPVDLWLPAALAGPARRDTATVRAATRSLIALDGRYGGAPVAALARRQAGAVSSRLRPHHQDPERARALQSAAAELAQVAGWIHFDVEEHASAARLNRWALALSRLAGARGTALLTLLTIAMQDTHLGRPARTLATTTAVLDRGRLSPRVEAMFRVRAARALSVAGQDGTARSQFRRARSLLLDGTDGREPAWAWWIDETEIAGHEGAARIDAADRHSAVPLLESAVDAIRPDAPQYRSVVAAKLLLTYVELRAWADAVRVADAMLDRPHPTGSRRTATVLRRIAGRTDSRTPGSVGDRVRALADATGTR